MRSARIAIVGHVEHVTLGRAQAFPAAGDIVHLLDPRVLAAGGGGLAFAQLCRSDAEVHFFTAVGHDDGGREVLARITREGGLRVHVHAARREVPHPRVVVLVDGEGRRTIFVTEAPLQPIADDPLPWPILATCDAVYFTGADPESLRLARLARQLVVSARRGVVLRAAGVAPDVIVGSRSDARENAAFETYAPAPRALVLTDGPRAIDVIRPGGARTSVDPPPLAEELVRSDYGAGDSFAAALTFFLGHGLGVEEACRRAAPFGAAVLRGLDPVASQAPLVAP
jgi:ribokinase